MNKVILFALSISGLFACTEQRVDAEWAFIYWMPYDNNLSEYADTINFMINSGIRSDNIVATVQTDLNDSMGMQRHVISHGNITTTMIPDESSSSGKSYLDYLIWVTETISAQNYAIIFMNHGGKLDEVGLDEYPENGFLKIDSARMAIESFNLRTGKAVELLFYQVCTKGSIEAIYEMKDVAKYTLFSQTLLGAPNYYYPGLFKNMSTSEQYHSGLDIANLIVENEREDMYYSYVCTKNSEFQAFTIEFYELLNQSDSIQYELYENRPLEYMDQYYWDCAAFFESLENISTADIQKTLGNLIVMNSINPAYSTMDGYSGLSFLALNKDYPEHVQRYQSLRFFQTFDMMDFYNKLVESK